MREKILFDDNWLFHKGDIKYAEPHLKGPVYTQAKTERVRFGPACIHYSAVSDDFGLDHEINPERWDEINLPHDYIIEQMPRSDKNNGLGYFEYENAWYRKTFTLSEQDREKRICLYFEGVATHAEIYINGCLVKRNFCGYTSFEADITDFVDFDRENVLAVYVDTQNHEGWWYEGAGIYRHVWLIKTDRAAVDLWGVYVAATRISDSEWKLDIENTIRNDYDREINVEVITDILNGGETVASFSKAADIARFMKTAVKMSGRIENPILWDLDNPHQYKAVTRVYTDGKETDCYETKFGFRHYDFDKDKGLFLNGRHVKIKGVCAHQDFGLTGKAVADNIQRHKIRLIKEMGANGYRCSHYPHSEATMDALDENGFIVMNETRWFDSSDEGMRQLEMLIKRDRNRPSVLFWSTGNEEPKHITHQGRKIQEKMAAAIRSLDNSRMITAAVSYSPLEAKVFDSVDVIGINYNLEVYDSLHKSYPDKPIMSTECCATGTTRGWYYDDAPQKGYINAFDKDTNEAFLGREKTWRFMSEREWILGAYQWIAFEHRGECLWPRLCSQSGAIDLFLQKKDAFYQNQSLWIEDRAVIHLLPHWNFEGREGEPIRVGAYTNCDEAELFLNGESLGRKDVGKISHAEWNVKYKPGELRVVGYKNNIPAIEDSHTTSGRAYSLKFKAENEVLHANGRDVLLLTCFCTDENGIEVPDASPYVSFTSNKNAMIIATGSDICDHTPPYVPERKMRMGRISVAVQVGKEKGEVKVYAEAQNLKTAVFSLELNE